MQILDCCRWLIPLVSLFAVLVLTNNALANFGPPLHERPQPLEVTTSKSEVTEIHIPKKLLPARGFGAVEQNEAPFWSNPAIVRTIVAGLFLSAAAVGGLLLLRRRQTKLATAAVLVAAVSLGVMGTSIADIAPPPTPEEAPDKAEVVLKFVDGDAVTIVKGTRFPK